MKILEHPYQDLNGGRWVRGNLHSHTTLSDGRRSIEEVVSDYKSRGYGFLMISDHDVFSSPEKIADLQSKEMVLIPGNEISQFGCHLLHVNAGKHLAPDPRRQVILNEIARDKGSFAIVCHPNWHRFDYTSITQLQEWVGYTGIEIYNGVIGRLDGSPYATDKWDLVLSSGRCVWGYANDDSHRAEDVELGWNQAYIKEDSPTEMVAALREGRFYASTGVEIRSIAVEGMRVRIETANAARIVALREIGRRFAVVDSHVMEVEVPEDAVYVRFECWGTGERMAWTQPFIAKEL